MGGWENGCLQVSSGGLAGWDTDTDATRSTSSVRLRVRPRVDQHTHWNVYSMYTYRTRTPYDARPVLYGRLTSCLHYVASRPAPDGLRMPRTLATMDDASTATAPPVGGGYWLDRRQRTNPGPRRDATS